MRGGRGVREGVLSMPNPDCWNAAAAKYALGYSDLSGDAWRFLTDEGGGSELLTTVVAAATTMFWVSLPGEYQRVIGEDDPRYEASMVIVAAWEQQRAGLCKKFRETFRVRVTEPARRVLVSPCGNYDDYRSTVNGLLGGNYENMSTFIREEGMGAVDTFIKTVCARHDGMLQGLLKQEIKKIGALAESCTPRGDTRRERQREANRRIRRFESAENIFSECFKDSRRIWRRSAESAVGHFGWNTR